MCRAGPVCKQAPRAILSFSSAGAEAEVLHYGGNWSAATPRMRSCWLDPKGEPYNFLIGVYPPEKSTGLFAD